MLVEKSTNEHLNLLFFEQQSLQNVQQQAQALVPKTLHPTKKKKRKINTSTASE